MSKKISELTAATTPLSGTETVEIVQGGTSKKVAVSYFGGGGGGRETLSANRTYYVRTDGSDSNDGLADSSGGAFLTIQKSVDVICETLDTSIYTATCQIKDGTFTGAVTLKAHVGSLPYVIQGNATTPANVHINVTGVCFTSSDNRVTAKIRNLKMTSTSLCVSSTAGVIELAEGIEYGAATNRHINAQYLGYVNITGNYTIGGGGQSHWVVGNGGKLRAVNRTITLTGTPAFSSGFAVASDTAHIVCSGNTYSGSATGPRYSVTMNATIQSGATTLPGDSAGTTATGGQYA